MAGFLFGRGFFCLPFPPHDRVRKTMAFGTCACKTPNDALTRYDPPQIIAAETFSFCLSDHRDSGGQRNNNASPLSRGVCYFTMMFVSLCGLASWRKMTKSVQRNGITFVVACSDTGKSTYIGRIVCAVLLPRTIGLTLRHVARRVNHRA